MEVQFRLVVIFYYKNKNGIIKKLRRIGRKKEKLNVRTCLIPRVGFGISRITDSNGPRTG